MIAAITENFPAGLLNANAERVAEIIRTFMRQQSPTFNGGGAQTFYDPELWKERGETYGLESVLIVVHDGGDLAPYCNHDYQNYAAMERLSRRLAKSGLHIEQCTCWYSAVYEPLPK